MLTQPIPTLTIANEKTIWLGDTHFGARNDSQLFHNRFELFYDHLFEYMLQNDIKQIVQFGDLFDRRKYVSFTTLKRSKEYFFEKLKLYGFELVVFLGNHDIAFKNTLEVNSPDLLLQEYDNIRIVTEPTELIIGPTKHLMLPWICFDNYERTMECIEESDAPYCLGHLELAGFEMYRGSPCDHGLDASLFAKFHKVWTGHYHHISYKDNIVYIGSPYQITWSDYGDERGFFVFDPATREALFVRNPYDQFFKLNYDDSKFSVEELLDSDFSVYDQTFVKVIVIEKNDLYLYDQFIEALEKAGAFVTTVEDHRYRDVESDEDIAAGVENTEDILRNAAESYSQSIDTERLYVYLMELHNEAVNLQTV